MSWIRDHNISRKSHVFSTLATFSARERVPDFRCSVSEANEEPELRFLDKRPENLVAQPPLASSLQNFESCLFLIALGRYPHAFTACAFAIESALKAAFDIPSEDWRRVPLDRRGGY